MKNISLLELARKAGVSKTTASLILNGKSDRYKISSATKARVLSIAAENGYKPNILARNLSMGKSMTVGVIIRGINDTESAWLIEGIEKELSKREYQIVIGFTAGDAEKRRRIVSEMVERRVDGIVSVYPEGDIESESIPVVSIGNKVEGAPAVLIDIDAGIRKLIGYWYPRGKRSIGYVGHSAGNDDCKSSYKENYIERFSMQGDNMLLLKNENDHDRMKNILTSLTAKGVNAILFETSGLAYLALKVVKELKDRELNDISFGSFGYHPAFDVVDKEVIYVTKPTAALAEKSVNLLFDLMGGDKPTDNKYVIEPIFSF
jgi:LacI family transcriptional regulator